MVPCRGSAWVDVIFSNISRGTDGRSTSVCITPGQKVFTVIPYLPHSRAIDRVIPIIAALVAALLIGLGLALFIARIISRPLRLAADAAEQLAEGNLSAQIESGAKDETGMVLNAMHAPSTVTALAENGAAAPSAVSIADYKQSCAERVDAEPVQPAPAVAVKE